MRSIKRYVIEDEKCEIHMMGEYVGVCWHIYLDEDEGGLVRDGAPRIDFPIVREKDGKVWTRDDLSIQGGITADVALLVAAELALAISYIHARGWESL